MKHAEAFSTDGYSVDVADTGRFLQDLMEHLGLEVVAELDEYGHLIGYKFYKKSKDYQKEEL